MFGLAALSTIFGNFKWQIIAGIAILAILASMVFYWNYSQNKIADLSAKNAQLTSVVSTQNATISTLRTDFARAQKDLNIIAGQYSTLDKQATAARKAAQIPVITKSNKKQIEQGANAAANSLFHDINADTQIETF